MVRATSLLFIRFKRRAPVKNQGPAKETRLVRTGRRPRRVGRSGDQVKRYLRNLDAVEAYRPGPEHYGDDKVLPELPWGRGLRQGKAGISLTMPFALFTQKPYGLALSEAVARL